MKTFITDTHKQETISALQRLVKVPSYLQDEVPGAPFGQDVLDALKECNDAEIVKNEISFTRKAALENLVQLHGQSYFAGPSVARNLQKERERKIEKRKQANTRIRINKN